MAFGNIYEAKFNVYGPERPWSFSMGYKQTGGVIGADTLEFLAAYLQTRIDDAFTDFISWNHVVESIEVRQVTEGDDIPGVTPMPAGRGDVEFTALPNSSPILILWKTIAPNAKYNGKTYLSGIPISSVTNGILDAAPAVLMQTWADEMMADITLTGGEDAEFTPVIISRVEDGVKRPTPIGYELESASINLAIKNQRRRRTQNKGIPSV